MSEEIIKVIDNLAQKFGVAIDWTNQNITPYLQDLMARYVQYDTVINIVWLIANVFITILGIILAVVLFKIYKNESKKDWREQSDTKMMFSGVIGVLLVIVSFISLLSIPFNINSIIQNKYIPEKTIYEFLTTNINK